MAGQRYTQQKRRNKENENEKKDRQLLGGLSDGGVPASGGSSAADSQVVYYDDGSYEVITVEKTGGARASTITSGTVTHDRYSTAGTLEWKAVLKASFSYNGSTSTCISVNIPVVTIYNDNWSVVSQTSSKSGNTATANITMGLKQIIGTSKVPITLTLSCDKYGNLS